MKELGGSAESTVAASPEECFELAAAVDRYPSWYPEAIRSAEVLDRDPAGRPSRVRTVVHVAVGPVVRDFNLLMDVSLAEGREVKLSRARRDPSDSERFDVVWRVTPGPSTRLGLELAATLEVPRLVPLGGVGDRLAQGFVEAAKRELEGAQ